MSIDYSTLIYTAAQVRDGEREAASRLGISMAQLMQRAAQACLRAVQRQQSAPARLLVLCGPGNNGGDGWVLARIAQQAGYKVQIAALPPTSELTQTAAAAWQDLGYTAIDLATLKAEHFIGVDIVVDALFGSGLTRALDDTMQNIVQLINQQAAQQRNWVLGVDVPTGLNSDTGQPQPVAVYCHHTVTMVATKVGLVTGLATNYCGAIELADLGIANAFYQQPPSLKAITRHSVIDNLPRRAPAAHKGDYGHLLVIAAGPGMSGAAVLAGRAALRCGAGKVSVVCHPQSQTAIAVQQPELMVHALEQADNLEALLKKADAVVVGPGLGQSDWARSIVQRVSQWHGPVVWDADALNVLAVEQSSQLHRKPAQATWLLTPHPGEAGRLLGTSSAAVNADRMAALTQLCQNFQAHVLLKGAGTLVQSPLTEGAATPSRWVCRRGSPALASGGSGDVLSGIIGALLTQGLAAETVLPQAAWLHAVAGEHAAQGGERGTLASDVISELRALVNPLQALNKRVKF